MTVPSRRPAKLDPKLARKVTGILLTDRRSVMLQRGLKAGRLSRLNDQYQPFQPLLFIE